MTDLELSCGLPPGPDFADLVVLAEELGYTRAWIYDSAPLWEDPFVHLALAAERTTRIARSRPLISNTGTNPPSSRRPVRYELTPAWPDQAGWPSQVVAWRARLSGSALTGWGCPGRGCSPSQSRIASDCRRTCSLS